MKKYIVFCKERSRGPQCNLDHIFVVDSDSEPNEEILKHKKLLYTGSCSNISYPGCEECSGSYLDQLLFELYSSERALALGLVVNNRENY
jgi:hypothetical protein